MSASAATCAFRACLLVALAGALPDAFGWVYPEHRDIAVLAVERLDPDRRAQFDRLWAEARAGDEKRLCATGADATQGTTPSCIDWAALSAIAGDHSCSSTGMLDAAVASPWILSVANVAAQLKVDLARIRVDAKPQQGDSSKGLVGDFQRYVDNEAVRAERQNALRTADTRLQRADPAYATRAGSNGAHFLLPRPRTDTTPRGYAELTLTPGSEINAVGVYAWHHLSALQKASRLAHEQLTPDQRNALARAMLADEAFALHFLEDTFAAGHVAGSWGDTSQRKGTHDYYNESGLEAFVWKGSSDSMVLMGDAHMLPGDADRAAADVRVSLEQIVNVATGHDRTPPFPYAPRAGSLPDTYDVCKTNVLPARDEGGRAPPEAVGLLAEVLMPTPVPGLGPGLGSLPRFRAEVGPFVGLAGSAGLRRIDGGLVETQTQHGWIGDVDLSVRAGLGLDGVLGEAGDGLVFASLGIRGDSASTSKLSSADALNQAGSLTAAIPNRMGISTRLRMPFYLVPGDLLLLSPLYLISPSTYTGMAVTASNGGLIPWQLGWATRFGRFQFVLGRELGATFYGRRWTDTLIAPSGVTPGEPAKVVNFKSVFYDLPILEYRPYRAFDIRQSSAVLFQLYLGADIPQGTQVVAPAGASMPGLKTVYSIGVRAIFDWRHYF